MKKPPNHDLDSMWARHHAAWRETAQITSQWEQARDTNPELLRYQVRGGWWDILEKRRITLLVTREYEHLIMALGAKNNRPLISYMPMPHPSGLVADRQHQRVYVASTRNPNQVFELAPVSGFVPRLDAAAPDVTGAPLVPTQSRFFPGSLYMHDLALIGGELYANAVGQNAIVRLDGTRPEAVWWPRCMETPKGPLFGRNHIQLNSIAPGESLQRSFFTASSDTISARRPGHSNYPVDGRGVIFSGETREPIVRGLTRPHSARLNEGAVWVDNSGYGELAMADGGDLNVVAKLPGWTRGLCIHGDVAFVGTSRVLPRFRQYAPGLDVERSVCGLHAVDVKSGAVLGSLIWPSGNQLFAIDWMPASVTCGFPFTTRYPKKASAREKHLFYSFTTDLSQQKHQ